MFGIFTPRFKGLKILNNKSGFICFQITGQTTKSEISAFIKSLPQKYALSFFDNFHPQISDPGAYVTIQKMGGGILAHFIANHGWSTEWREITFKV